MAQQTSDSTSLRMKRMMLANRLSRLTTAVSLFILLTLFAPGRADAINPKIEPHLFKQIEQNRGRSEILVKLKGRADLTGAAKLTNRTEKGLYVFATLKKAAEQAQGDLLRFLDRRGLTHRAFYISNIVVIENADWSLTVELSQRADVDKIYGNPATKKRPPHTTPTFLAPLVPTVRDLLLLPDAEQAWTEYKTRGEGITIANQDTGMQWDHPALKTQYRGWNGNTVDHNYNWHDAIQTPMNPTQTNQCGYALTAPCDDEGHGTHTTGTAVGSDGGENQIGVAPGAKWIGCRNMDHEQGRLSTYIDCFEFFLAPYPIHGDARRDGDPTKAPHIINNSWTCLPEEGCGGDEMQDALIALKAAGIFVISAAGNDGDKCGTINGSPGFHSGLTFSVGAIDSLTGLIADFSSRGPSSLDGGLGPDITAPGVGIRSSVPGDGYDGNYSGTSEAAPFVAGAVALLWSADPTLIGDVEQTATTLRLTADPKTSQENCGGVEGTSWPNNTYGWGTINILAAIRSRIGQR